MANGIRTTNVRGIWSCKIEPDTNGAFTVELRHAVGPNREPHRLVLHFDGFWWVGRIAEQLWPLVAKRREQLAGEIAAAEKRLKGGDA